MRDPRELLALLTAKVQRFQVAPGGIPFLTPQDMAQALGMIKHPSARLYARVKYCQQYDFAEELAINMRYVVLRDLLDGTWKIPREAKLGRDVEFILDLCRLAIYEACDPNLCPWCLGRAEVRPETGPVIVCSACRGTGQRTLRGVDRARLLGLPTQRWSDWSERYRDIQAATVDKYEGLICGALRNRIA